MAALDVRELGGETIYALILLRALRRRLVLFFAVFLCILILASTQVLTAAPTYSSTSKMFVSIRAASSAADLSAGSSYLQQLLSSYAQLATTPYVLERVRSDLRLIEGVDTLASQVTATGDSSSVLVSIKATSGSPTLSADIANSVTKNLILAVAALAPDSSNATASVKITQVQPAMVDTAPAGASKVSLLSLVALLALIVAVVVAVAADRLSTRVRNEHDVRRVTESPILGRILRDNDSSTSSLLLARSSVSASLAEAYESLRASLKYVRPLGGSSVVVVTSSTEGEGKSTTACNLAIAMASAGASVLLVDADLRRPKLASYLGLDDSLGLSNVLVGEYQVTDVVQPWGDGSLAVLCAGPLPPNPGQLIQSSILGELFEELSSDYDLVLVDAPPVLPVSDASVLASQAAGALVVAALGSVKSHELSRTLVELTQFNAQTLGLVLTHVPRRGVDSAYNSYAYESPTLPQS